MGLPLPSIAHFGEGTFVQGERDVDRLHLIDDGQHVGIRIDDVARLQEPPIQLGPKSGARTCVQSSESWASSTSAWRASSSELCDSAVARYCGELFLGGDTAIDKRGVSLGLFAGIFGGGPGHRRDWPALA